MSEKVGTCKSLSFDSDQGKHVFQQNYAMLLTKKIYCCQLVGFYLMKTVIIGDEAQAHVFGVYGN